MNIPVGLIFERIIARRLFTKGIINRLYESFLNERGRPTDAVLRDDVDLPLNRRTSHPLIRTMPFLFVSRLAFIDYLNELSCKQVEARVMV